MKKFQVLLCLSSLLTSFSSCRDSDYVIKENIEIIPVNTDEIETFGKFEDYFSESTIIPLETTSESLLADIDRISFHNNKIFILDKKSNSILIFEKTGKFLTRINNIGGGPAEYISLMDFAIDNKKNLIILYTDRPYKIMAFDFDGNFIEEKRLKNLYTNIAHDNGKLLMMNGSLNRKFMLFERDVQEQSEIGMLRVSEIDLIFDGSRLKNPSLVKDKSISAFFPYSNIIYRYNAGDGLTARYEIDFGDSRLPSSAIQKGKTFSDIFNYAHENNYGFGINNFRESNRFITFTYGRNNLVIFSKQLKSSKIYNGFINEGDGMPFINYFAHDGDDNKIMSILNADSFLRLIGDYKSDNKEWENLSDSTKILANSVAEVDNPILILYTFKTDSIDTN